MRMACAQPLPEKWKDRLDLAARAVPEFYEDADTVGQSAHANAIRLALAELSASAVICVQNVPTVIIVVLDEFDRDQVINLHGALWNQGLATLLLVITGDTLKAFSLARIPYRDGSEFDERCLIDTLDATTDALAVEGIIYGAESGRLWEHHSESFKASERIDQFLLNNLTVSYQLLRKDDLYADAAQALLVQVMFIAYLEHREIIQSEYFKEASNGNSASLLEILESSNPTELNRLFKILRNDFQGDLFVAPCSFDPNDIPPPVLSTHLKTLARFLSGRVEMEESGGQLRIFWGYNFKYIPIELISAVYDRFLGERTAERKSRGAYYTPMFLADTVIAALWDKLPPQTHAKGQFLDPACGSGVFLVRAFQLLCEHWRETHGQQSIEWASLCAILERLNGWDITAGAVRVAVFSLYLALLQEVEPPDMQLLIKDGKRLPKLWDRTLLVQDFFDVSPEKSRADVIFGNPPWTSRQGPDRKSVIWSTEHQMPMPSQEDAWAFVWKALRHVDRDGFVGFLLPAMGLLHNVANKAVEARRRLIREARIIRIVNFADMRFQLFERAVRPATLVLFGRADAGSPDYRFDYWTPKADLNLKNRRVITLSSIDKQTVTSREAVHDPFVFKRRLWISNPESKLLGYLDSFPKLSDLVRSIGSIAHRSESLQDHWIIGRGFAPANGTSLTESKHHYNTSDLLADTPYLPIERFTELAQESENLQTYEHNRVYRKGFERGFSGPRVLIPRGIRKGGHRLRASYLEEPLAFMAIMLAITVPTRDARRAKLLTALLNSKLLFWYAFHCTASLGSDRPELQQAELLRFPFPNPDDFQESSRAEAASIELVSIIDEARLMANESAALRSEMDSIFRDLDQHCYTYFGLHEEQIALVEDVVNEVIPCSQPTRGSAGKLWRQATHRDRKAYASALAHSMSHWFDEDTSIRIVLEARNEDLALLRLALVQRPLEFSYREQDGQAIGEALGRLRAHIGKRLPGNFQLEPDFRLFMGENLYIIKPLQRRFWLISTAIADADSIAMDLHDAVVIANST